MKKFLGLLVVSLTLISIVKASVLEEALLCEPSKVAINQQYSNSDLWQLTHTQQNYTSYSSIEECEKSLKTWALYSRALYVLTLRKDQEAEEKFSWAKENRKSFFDNADFYVEREEDYPLVLLGSWSQIALYEPSLKESFLKDCEEGQFIPKNNNFQAFVKAYAIN